MEEREQRKRGTMEALSNERMYILLKYNREMMLELKSLLPNDEELLEGYKAFQEAFNILIDSELENRYKRLEDVQPISIAEAAEKIAEGLAGFAEKINQRFYS